ncbi:hypothetical protein [Pseudanabaena mucicola]|uniref:Uncharacterized protein n=1 Tax=Pseudanabaena mucicola FACHB-723 TaxID=2692860 RepID=A0ABR8A0Q5_9CYAN|nr:hypothetical protein [Pseudanabaena mucicola]MBD2189121.1 hypothetical protein [Pseudanabaena mucicola FACHB-723]
MFWNKQIHIFVGNTDTVTNPAHADVAKFFVVDVGIIDIHGDRNSCSVLNYLNFKFIRCDRNFDVTKIQISLLYFSILSGGALHRR